METVEVELEGHAYAPSWSPDGRSLAFEVDPRDGGPGAMFVAQPPREPVRVEVADAAAASWHREGWVVFEGAGRIWYRVATGGASAELLAPSEVPGELSSPVVSPDGGAVAFVADGDLFLRETRTGRIRRLTGTPSATEDAPAFDPTGTRVAFTRDTAGDEDVVVLDLDGAEAVVAGGPGDQVRPAFAAGRRLLYFDDAREPGHWDLVASRDGAAVTLAEDVRLPLRSRPAVSPDGLVVAWAPDDPGRCGITLVHLDSGESSPVEAPFASCAEPALSDRAIAFTALPASGSGWRVPVIAALPR